MKKKDVERNNKTDKTISLDTYKMIKQSIEGLKRGEVADFNLEEAIELFSDIENDELT